MGLLRDRTRGTPPLRHCGTGQPRVVGNDWRSLTPPSLGAWEPSRTVTVVVPAHNGHGTLPYTLASLAAQTYPSHLMQVIVVDDGSQPPLRLPGVRPEDCRIEQSSGSWGRAGACAFGAEIADGSVIHWLDADMLVDRHHVEAQMRWHHLIDYGVVLGQKQFVDPREGLPTVEAAREAVESDRTADLFAGVRWRAAHEWIETKYNSTDLLTRSPFRAYRAHVGATASVPRDLYLRSGGMDAALKLGEDIELGYRLAQRGAVFVPDLSSTSWHLGVPSVLSRQQEVNAHNRPYIANRVSDFRSFRKPGRNYTVPHVEVVVDVEGQSFEDVTFTVDSVLSGRPTDVRAVLRGQWPEEDVRVNRLEDPRRDLWLIQAEYDGEPRVALTHAVPPTSFPAMFRLHLPPGWALEGGGLNRLLKWSESQEAALTTIRLPDAGPVRLERTAVVERAIRLRDPSEDLDEVIAQIGTVRDATADLRQLVSRRTTTPAPLTRSHGALVAGL